MDAHYGSWVPATVLGGITGVATALGAASTAAVFARRRMKPATAKALISTSLAGTVGAGTLSAFAAAAHRSFDLDRPGSMARRMVEGTASFIKVPRGGTILDIGCGSGALTIACAKNNPTATVVGIDRWKMPYDYYSRELCEANALAEGVTNVEFACGDARDLPFPTESFDAVVSNYVYHNVPGTNRHDVLSEGLRVVAKGGTFAIHDTFSPLWFGNMRRFIAHLEEHGYSEVELLPSGDGLFISPWEKRLFFLYGTAVLWGVK